MAKRTSSFGDYALSVLFPYLSPLTLLSLCALAALWLVVGGIIGSSNPTSPLSLFILVLLISFISSATIGRFAAGARQGEFAAGLFLNGSSLSEAFQFGINHLALLVVWELPLFGIVLLLKDNAINLISPFGDGGGKGSAIIILIVMFLAAIGPTLTTLPAACADSLWAAFNRDLWRRIFGQRLDDVLFFYVCLFGGLITFVALYAVPLSIIALLAPSDIGPVAALIVRIGAWLPVLASATVPILVGRLAGAFAYSEIYADTIHAATFPASKSTAEASSTTSPAPPTHPPGPGPAVREPAAALSSGSVEWLRGRLSSEPLVFAAYFFEKRTDAGNYERKIGLELDEEQSSLADRQKLFLTLSAEAPRSPLAADEATIGLLNTTTRVVIQKIGRLVYRRD